MTGEKTSVFAPPHSWIKMNVIMKHLFLIIACVCTLNAMGQGIEFFPGTLDEALAKAKDEGKMVFVDFMASWCGPCQKMAEEVFTEEMAGVYFNRKFVCVQVDVDKEKELAKQYGVVSIPHMVFLAADGKTVKQLTGYTPVEKLVETAMYAAGDMQSLDDQWAALQKDKGNLALQQGFLLQAPGMMASLGNPKEVAKWQFRVEKVVKHYLAAKPREEMINAEDAAIIMMYCSQPRKDNEPVEYMIAHLDDYLQVVPVYTLIGFFATYQDALVQELAKKGDLDYKKQIARLQGDLKPVFDSVKTRSLPVEYLMTTKADGNYLLYAKKDQEGYINLQKAFFEKMGDLAGPDDYRRAVMSLMDVCGSKLKAASATEAIGWLDKLLSGNLDINSRVRFLAMTGDCYVALGNSEKARGCYNQAYTLGLQLGDVYFLTGLREKLNLLD